MNVQRGDVVLVNWPFAGGQGGKMRPALVVQNDRDNRRMHNTIVAMITSRTDHATRGPTQLLIDPSTEDGRVSGLRFESAVKFSNLFTIEQSKIVAKIGILAQNLCQIAEECLRVALALPNSQATSAAADNPPPS